LSPDLKDSWTSPLVVAAAAFALALALVPMLRALARRFGLLDRPNQRSSHARAVPRAGGVAVLASVLAALAVVPAFWQGQAATVVLGALALGVLGLADDRFGLPPGARITAQLAVALYIVGSVGPIERLPFPPPFDPPLGALGTPLSVLWIVAVVNFFNFLDGIDGLAALQAAVTAAGIAAVSWEAGAVLLAAALAGAAAGFLPFNWSPASVFLGDAGSYFLGCVLAALPLLAAPQARSSAVLFVALSLWFFLADASLTLARRAARGARVWQAHREHLYQDLSARLGHARVTLSLGAASLLLTAIGVGIWRSGATRAAWAALALALALFAGEWGAARRVRAA
jgi:UDP-N-acetylmuramyl pentapeptide phosphotransferase/UDP-N-acetylglucosamine-1-phosphate transferase